MFLMRNDEYSSARECNTQSGCAGFFSNAALSECELLSVPSACTPEGYVYYKNKLCTTASRLEKLLFLY